MKVLLVEPPFSPFDVPQGLVGMPEPLALETVAAQVCLNHDVTILDMRIEDNLEYYLEKIQPDVIGVGSVTANLHLAKQILQKAKTNNPNILTIIGGHHVTFMPQDVREDFIDVVVIGEGDYSMAQVINAFENHESFSEIPGIAINRKGQQFITKQAILVDLDKLLTPARHLVSRYREHYFQRVYRPIVSINTSRGCPYRCQFCSLWVMNRGKYRTRSAELIIDEIKTFKEDFIDFIDDNSLEDIRRAYQLVEFFKLNRIQKRFRLYARANTIAKNPELIQQLANVGLELILVGFEAIREDKLADWNKKCTFEMNNKAIEILNKNKIKIAAYFLVDPKFKEADFSDLWNYVDGMKLSDPIFTILVPFPGTDLFKKEMHNIISSDYRMFDFFHTVFKPKLPLKDFYHQFAVLYQKAYAPERQLQFAPPHISKAAFDAHLNIFTNIFSRINDLQNHHMELLEKH